MGPGGPKAPPTATLGDGARQHLYPGYPGTPKPKAPQGPEQGPRPQVLLRSLASGCHCPQLFVIICLFPAMLPLCCCSHLAVLCMFPFSVRLLFLRFCLCFCGFAEFVCKSRVWVLDCFSRVSYYLRGARGFCGRRYELQPEHDKRLADTVIARQQAKPLARQGHQMVVGPRGQGWGQRCFRSQNHIRLPAQ